MAGAARSLSEFARSTVLQGLTTRTETRESFEQVISSLLDDLRRELQELTALIRATPKAQQ